MILKKAEKANSKPLIDTGFEFGMGVLDAEAYQSIHRKARQSPIMDLDAIQRARFAVKQHVCEEVIFA